MSISPNKNMLRIGRGKLFVKRLGGTNEGFLFAGQTSKIDLQMGISTLIERDVTSASNGILSEIVTEKTPTVTATFKQFENELVALAFLGDRAAPTQAATPVTAEQHDNVIEGSYVKLDSYGPVASVAVKGSGGSPTYAIDDDYTIENTSGDALHPLIYSVPGGAITTGSDIEVDYTPPAYTAIDQIKGLSESEILCELLYVDDPTVGPQYDI